MSDNSKVVEDKKTEVKTVYTAEDFQAEYQQLCQRSGFQIVVNPAFKARDDGTFSVVLQASIGKLAKEN